MELAAALDRQVRRGEEWQDFFLWEPGSHFPFAFTWLGSSVEEESGGVRFAVALRRVYADRFKVRLSAWREGSALRESCNHDSSCLCAESAVRLAGHVESAWSSLLERGVESAAGELEILSAAERARLLVELNRTPAVGYGREVCLHVLFERQAERTPESVAVSCESGCLTYGELESRANRLSHHLRGLGVGVETPVALCVERSLEMVVGALGILEAGGAYVPLDPSYPGDRLASMLEDSGARCLVTSGAPGSWATGVRVLDLSSAAWQEEPAVRLPAAAEPGHLAYVIYTSGSTGRPKGVMVSHRSILNRLLWMQERFPLTSGDVLLQKTPLGFDASVWELFVPLLSGAGLLLARPGGQQDAAYLVDTVASQGVTVLQLVPSFLRVFLAEPGLELRCVSLRRLFSGGEARCPRGAGAPPVVSVSAGVELCNLYGPTESSIDATYQPLGESGGEGEGLGADRPPPAGR